MDLDGMEKDITKKAKQILKLKKEMENAKNYLMVN